MGGINYMALEAKSKEVAVRSHNLVRLPAVVCEESGIEGKGSKVQVLWGRNYRCVVILPINVQLGKIVRDRINNLCNEPLETER